jgi:hypothetical protein
MAAASSAKSAGKKSFAFIFVICGKPLFAEGKK